MYLSTQPASWSAADRIEIATAFPIASMLYQEGSGGRSNLAMVGTCCVYEPAYPMRRLLVGAYLVSGHPVAVDFEPGFVALVLGARLWASIFRFISERPSGQIRKLTSGRGDSLPLR